MRLLRLELCTSRCGGICRPAPWRYSTVNLVAGGWVQIDPPILRIFACTWLGGFDEYSWILQSGQSIGVTWGGPSTGTNRTTCVNDASEIATIVSQLPFLLESHTNVMSLSSPWPGITLNALAILCPLIMAILSQVSGTRVCRVCLYPFGVICAVLAILSLKDGTQRTRLPGGKADS